MNSDQSNSKLSIIVPVYNVASYLRQCLDSLVGQTYHNLEIILVDDGSTDGSEKLCDQYAAQDNRVRVIHQENRGVAGARVAGARLASGAHMTFVDGDDYLDSDWLENLMNCRGDYDLVTAAWIRDAGEQSRMAKDSLRPGAYTTEKDMRFLWNHMVSTFSPGGKTALEAGITSFTWNKLFRTEKAQEILAGVDISIAVVEDMDFTYRYLLACKSVLITDINGYHYRIRFGSASHVGENGMRYLENAIRVYQKLLPVFESQSCAENLVPQLQIKLSSMMSKAARKIGIDSKFQSAGYAFPFGRSLEGKKVALYGAGIVGRVYRYQILRNHLCKITAWVDDNWQEYQRAGYEVDTPEKLRFLSFDFVVIAAWEKEEGISVQSTLEQMGIECRKVLWQPPIELL